MLGAGPTPEEERAAMETNRVFCPINFWVARASPFRPDKKGRYREIEESVFLSGRIEVARVSRPGDPIFVWARLFAGSRIMHGKLVFWA